MERRIYIEHKNKPMSEIRADHWNARRQRQQTGMWVELMNIPLLDLIYYGDIQGLPFLIEFHVASSGFPSTSFAQATLSIAKRNSSVIASN